MNTQQVIRSKIRALAETRQEFQGKLRDAEHTLVAARAQVRASGGPVPLQAVTVHHLNLRAVSTDVEKLEAGVAELKRKAGPVLAALDAEERRLWAEPKAGNNAA